jgi:hypothetical protein
MACLLTPFDLKAVLAATRVAEARKSGRVRVAAAIVLGCCRN